MKRILQHIMIIAAAACMLISCSKGETEVIPRGKLAKIYAEMLVTDQWITSTQGVRLMADTSLVYEPILEKYGYDIEDYLHSVDRYMDDPERYARIFRTTGQIIDKRLKELRKQQDLLERIANMPKIKSGFKVDEYFTYFFGEAYVHYYDSLAVEIDSVKMDYRLVSYERSDTTFDGLRMVIREIAPSDSLAVTDSLAVADSIAKADSISALAKKVKVLESKIPISPDEKILVRPEY